jgi:hypothetical protein
MLIQEAIKFHLKGMKEDGINIPEHTTFCDYVKVAGITQIMIINTTCRGNPLVALVSRIFA